MRAHLALALALLGDLLQAQTVQQPAVPVFVHRRVSDGLCDLVDKGILRVVDGEVVVVLESDPTKPLHPVLRGGPFSSLEYLSKDTADENARNLIDRAQDVGFKVGVTSAASFPASTPFVQPAFTDVRLPKCPSVEGALRWLEKNPVPQSLALPRSAQPQGGRGIVPPRVLYSSVPEYSEEGRKKAIDGVVVLWLIVLKNGRPAGITVVRPVGYGLDQKAVEAVRNWRFDPAKKDGEPISAQINVEVNFRLYK
jgi:TonB family protein